MRARVLRPVSPDQVTRGMMKRTAFGRMVASVPEASDDQAFFVPLMANDCRACLGSGAASARRLRWREPEPGSAAASSSGADTCAMLAATSLPETTIVSAQLVPAGAFTPPAQGAQAPRPIENLPAFCRVVATMRPVPDDVTMEVVAAGAGLGRRFPTGGQLVLGRFSSVRTNG